MRVRQLGDSAVLIDDFNAQAAQLAAALEQRLADVEAVPSYASVGVYFAHAGSHVASTEEALADLDLNALSSDRKHHLVPACYEMGLDLAEVAARAGISLEAVVEAHMATTYRCFAVGFCPGFPFLGYLRDDIAGLPRLDKPRLRVDPGMVGITGRQTGIYPLEVPGGWNLIARTPLTIVDVKEGYFPITAGDEISFTRIDENEYNKLLGERL